MRARKLLEHDSSRFDASPQNKIKFKSNSDLNLMISYSTSGSIASLSLEDICAKVSRNESSFRQVELFFERLNDVGLSRLSLCMSSNTTVTYMLIQGCETGIQGLRALAAMLRRNRTLQYFFFNEDPDVSNEGVVILVNGLLDNDTVQAISFEQLGISQSGAEALGRLLARNPFIIEASFAQNPLRDGGIDIANGLSLNRTLQVLSMPSCQLDSAEGVAILQATLNHPSLKRLDLNNNNLGSEISESLERLLLTNTNLDTLKVAGNNLGPPIAHVLARSLVLNTVLENLEVGRNRFGPSGAEALGRNLPLMVGLKDICLLGNSFGDEGYRFIAAGLQGNRNIVKANIGSIDETPVLVYFAAKFYERRNNIAWKILEDPDLSSGLWPLIFVKLRHEPEMIYFFLRERPTLISSPKG